MAIGPTTIWRARPSGNNANGGGFDCYLSPAATGSNGSFTGTTFTDAVAAAFTSGMVGSSISIPSFGQYLITAFINASNITLGSGNPVLTTPAGLSWTVGAGQDYSQQNAAQLVFNGTTVRATTAGVSNVITLVGYTATAADVGNCLHITGGTNFITGWYFITAQGGTTWTLDRNCTSGAGAAMTGNMGGGWADFFTNTTSTATLQPGNITYILGSGTPNPASYTFDYTVTADFGPPNGGGGANHPMFTFANDPATPGYKAPPDTTGGMPTIRTTTGSAFTGTTASSADHTEIAGLWFVSGAGSTSRFFTQINYAHVYGCVGDLNSNDFSAVVVSQAAVVMGNEIFSSSGGSGGGGFGIDAGGGTGVLLHGNNVHDCPGNGIRINGEVAVTCSYNISAKNGSNGIYVASGTEPVWVFNNTIDGNAGHGLFIDVQVSLVGSAFFNNIITNHTVAGKFGINLAAGTITANAGFECTLDYNTFYNNTANYNLLNPSLHDTILGVSPYVNSATENYTLV